MLPSFRTVSVSDQFAKKINSFLCVSRFVISDIWSIPKSSGTFPLLNACFSEIIAWKTLLETAIIFRSESELFKVLYCSYRDWTLIFYRQCIDWWNFCGKPVWQSSTHHWRDCVTVGCEYAWQKELEAASWQVGRAKKWIPELRRSHTRWSNRGITWIY